MLAQSYAIARYLAREFGKQSLLRFLGITISSLPHFCPVEHSSFIKWTSSFVKLDRVTQSVKRLAHEPDVPGWIPGLAAYFRFSFR